MHWNSRTSCRHAAPKTREGWGRVKYSWIRIWINKAKRIRAGCAVAQPDGFVSPIASPRATPAPIFTLELSSRISGNKCEVESRLKVLRPAMKVNWFWAFGPSLFLRLLGLFSLSYWKLFWGMNSSWILWGGGGSSSAVNLWKQSCLTGWRDGDGDSPVFDLSVRNGLELK